MPKNRRKWTHPENRRKWTRPESRRKWTLPERRRKWTPPENRRKWTHPDNRRKWTHIWKVEGNGHLLRLEPNLPTTLHVSHSMRPLAHSLTVYSNPVCTFTPSVLFAIDIRPPVCALCDWYPSPCLCFLRLISITLSVLFAIDNREWNPPSLFPPDDCVKLTFYLSRLTVGLGLDVR